MSGEEMKRPIDVAFTRRIEAQMRPRCGCGRWVSFAKPYGWFMHGEFGTEEGFVCASCLPGWVPEDGRGRGPDAGYCGIRAPASPPTLSPAALTGILNGCLLGTALWCAIVSVVWSVL